MGITIWSVSWRACLLIVAGWRWRAATRRHSRRACRDGGRGWGPRSGARILQFSSDFIFMNNHRLTCLRAHLFESARVRFSSSALEAIKRYVPFLVQKYFVTSCAMSAEMRRSSALPSPPPSPSPPPRWQPQTARRPAVRAWCARLQQLRESTKEGLPKQVVKRYATGKESVQDDGQQLNLQSVSL
eukprot:6195107-Pleurochrysis_carterae.AAC.5